MITDLGLFVCLLFCYIQLVSAVGIWVAQLGLKCTQTLNIQEIAKYALYLRWLAVAALVMRILWVFDIVEEVQRIVNDSQKAASSSAANGPSSTGEASTTTNVPLDDSVVQSYTIQVRLYLFSIIFSIYCHLYFFGITCTGDDYLLHLCLRVGQLRIPLHQITHGCWTIFWYKLNRIMLYFPFFLIRISA